MKEKKNEEIVFSVFKAYHSKTALTGDSKLNIVHICKILNLTYTEFKKQPAWWIVYSLSYAAGKNKAEEVQIPKKKSN